MIGLLLALAVAHAGPLEDGAAAYDEGQLDQAIEAWSAAAEGGRTASANTEYNVGTGYLRKGDAPRAIAHLRAALRHRPRDGRIHHNLAVARSMLENTPPAVGMPFTWMSVVTPGELGLLGVLLAGLGSTAILGARVRRGPGTLPGALLLVAGGAVGAVAVNGDRALQAHPVAVVTDAEAILRDGAMVNAGERHRLPPGTEVRVERSYHGFYLIEDSRGRRGWLAGGAAQIGW